MVKSTNGERLARLETNMTNVKEELSGIKSEFTNMKFEFGSKLQDIHIALLGDGKQNLGALSRIKSLEDSNLNLDKFSTWKYRILYFIITILTTISGFLGYLTFFN